MHRACSYCGHSKSAVIVGDLPTLVFRKLTVSNCRISDVVSPISTPLMA